MFADLRQKVGQGIAYARKKPKELAQVKYDRWVNNNDEGKSININININICSIEMRWQKIKI